MQKTKGIVFLLVLATGILAAPQIALALIPDAQNDEFSTPEDTPLNLIGPGVLGNDSDPEDESLTAELDSTTTNGELVLNADGSFDYTPNADFVGEDSFLYHANDGTADGNTATVTINVISVNDLPQAVNDEYSTEESTQLVVSAPGVLDNDTDTEDDTLTAVLDSTTTNGLLVLNSDGSFEYTPNADFVGEDSFSYHANDGTDDGNTATVTIQVNPQNSLIDLILEQIQMLFDKIFSVESEVAELKEQNAALETRVIALEAKMPSGSSDDDDHNHDDNHDKKSLKNEIKALTKEYKEKKEMLKDEFKEKERELKNQIKDLKHDKNHDKDDDDEDDDDDDDDDD